MKSSAISFLLISVLSSFCFADGKSEKVQFIGFNGGASVRSNTSDFEDEIILFRDSFFNGSATVLNANGSTSKVVPRDKYGYIDRTILGDVVFKPTALSNSKEANSKNLFDAVKQAASANPKAVTLFFTDHGSPDGVVAWNEDISYQNIKSIDDQFGDDTVVRRIHFHCYSGGALSQDKLKLDRLGSAALFEKIKDSPLRANTKSLSISTQSPDVNILSKYPKNRCAFSASREDEFSYGFNFEEEGLKKPLEALKQKRPAPSLADIKNVVMRLETYSATPQLTSDYFLQDVAKKLCSNRDSQSCSKSDSLGPQIKNLQSIVSAEFCQKVDNADKTNREYARKINQAYDRYQTLQEIQDDVAFTHVKEKYPAAFAAWKSAQAAKEALIRCQVITSSECSANKDKMKIQAERSDALEFYEKYLSLTSGGQYRRIPLTDSYYNFEWKDSAYTRKLDAAYQTYLQRSKAGVACGKGMFCSGVSYAAKAEASFEIAYNKASKEISDLQKTRKDFLLQNQVEIQSSLLTQLNRDDTKDLKDRYNNIRSCETSPINDGLR